MLHAVLSMNYLTLENVSTTTKKTNTRSDPSVSDSPDSSKHFAHYLLQKLIHTYFLLLSIRFLASRLKMVIAK